MSRNLQFPGAIKCKRPKMTDHAGRTWDSCKVFDFHGVEWVGTLDTSWGHYFYFCHRGQWYKASIDKFSIDAPGYMPVFSFQSTTT